MRASNDITPFGRKKFFWLYIIIAVVFLVSAYYYYQHEESILIEQKQQELESIAKLKINQISDWYTDQKEDVKFISRNRFLIEKIQQVLNNRERTVLTELSEILTNFKTEHDYSDIILTTTEAEIIVSTNPSLKKLNSNLSAMVIETANTNKIFEIDFFRSRTLQDKILLGFITPIATKEGETNVILIFLIDPEENIYPLIEHWPVLSQTSETFLFRTEGDNIIYLNELRHLKGTALELVLPKSKNNLPAAKAAEGYTGIYRGKDYRDINVVAYLSEIPGTKWYLIAKVDEHELFAGLLSKIEMVGLILLLLMGITGLGLYLAYTNRQHSFTESLFTKDKELWREQEKFKVTLDSLGQGVITLDVQGKVMYINKVAERLSGWSVHAARGRDLYEVYPVKNELTGMVEKDLLEKIYKQGLVKELTNHILLVTKEGREVPVKDTGAPIYDSEGVLAGASIVFQDETERREQERKIKASEERLRSTLYNMIEGCQIISPDYKYLFLNKAALESSRKTSEELLGNTMMECYPGIEKTEMFAKLKSCMELRVPENFVNEFTYPDGEQRVFNLHFEPVPEGLFILSEDITDLKSAQDTIHKFRMGIELSSDAIFLADKDGLITYVNPAFENIFGYKKEEVIGKTPGILKGGRLTPEEYQNFWNKLHFNEPVIRELVNKSKDNELVYVEASITPINNENNEIVGYLAIERDVTARKLADERRKQLIDILDATPDFVAIADKDLNSIFVNNAGKKMLGFDVNYDATNIRIAESHPEWARNIVLNEGLPTAAKEGIWIGETVLYSQNGKETPISQIIIAHKSENGDVKYFSTIGRDITERKKFENELIIAKNKAEEMNEVKTIFFANMSHELRTPFVGIMGYAEILLEELSNEEHKEMAKGILNTSQRMMDTLTKILKLTKLEVREAEITLNKTMLKDVIEEVYKNFLPAAKKENILLHKNVDDSLTSIVTDKDLVIDILFNLVSNAIKYTKEGEVTILTSKESINDKEFCSIKVIDTGIGIPEEKRDIVWMEFRQASEGSTRNYQGSGLGLAIVKKNTELLGGQISFESEVGKGTTFTLLLPLKN
ncbi:MAG: PAS domain S-box protein [Melioribacteraceae bacterium]|nr:PAS domain S-box protein [Melioribacteraceae bacterium]